MRVDQLLVQRGLAATRSQAQRMITAGVRWSIDGRWHRVGKNGEDVPPGAQIELLDPAQARFVSRGGLKLAGALLHCQLQVDGWLCLDLGQSTGGFTDCLLQCGAHHVVGVDAGSGQLHDTLRADPRVSCIEHLNARGLTVDDLAPAVARCEQLRPFRGFDLIVGDLAFISQTLVLAAVAPLLRGGGTLLMLVKPQFELQPAQIGRGGIVTDPALFAVVEQRVRTAHQATGLQVLAYFASSIQGGDGNQEFFIHSKRVQE